MTKNLQDEIKVYRNLVTFITNNVLNDSYKRIAFCRFLVQINSHLIRLTLCDEIKKNEYIEIVDSIINSQDMLEIRKNIELNDINKFNDKKVFFAKLLYRNKKNKYIFFSLHIYRKIMKMKERKRCLV